MEGGTMSFGHRCYALSADDKGNAWLIISRVVLVTLKQPKMNYPESGKACWRPERRFPYPSCWA